MTHTIRTRLSKERNALNHWQSDTVGNWGMCLFVFHAVEWKSMSWKSFAVAIRGIPFGRKRWFRKPWHYRSRPLIQVIVMDNKNWWARFMLHTIWTLKTQVFFIMQNKFNWHVGPYNNYEVRWYASCLSKMLIQKELILKIFTGYWAKLRTRLEAIKACGLEGARASVKKLSRLLRRNSKRFWIEAVKASDLKLQRTFSRSIESFWTEAAKASDLKLLD